MPRKTSNPNNGLTRVPARTQNPSIEGAPSLCLRSLQTQGGDFDFTSPAKPTQKRVKPLPLTFST
jgi:hypothetical protein